MMLYDHQRRIVERKPPRILLAWSTGTGKSLASIELVLQHTQNVLVICPKGLKQKWGRDLQYQMPTDSNWTVLTKEEFKKHAGKLEKFDGVIVDEAHTFAGMKSQLSKSLILYLRKHQINVRILLTATPYLSSPLNIYRLAQILGYNWNYIEFINRFFYYIPMGQRNVPVVKTGIEDEIANLVKQIGDVVKLDECVDVPDQIHEVEYFAMNPTQSKAVKKIKEEQVNPIVKFTKIHQVEQGTLKGDEQYEDFRIDIDKNARILQLAEEHSKIAVFCRYNLQIDHLKAMLEEAGKVVYVLRGDTPDRDAVVAQIEGSKACVALINSACSEGYELPSVDVIVYASLSFSFKDLRQSQGRFLRINRLKKNVFIYLLTADGIDIDVHKSLMNKQDFDIAIYAKNLSGERLLETNKAPF